MPATTHEILLHAWPERPWTMYGDTIIPRDGGPIPTPEEIEAARPAAEAAIAAAENEAATIAAREAMTLTRAQFGEMLIRRGIKAKVLAAINGIAEETEREIVLEWYEYAPTVRRTSPKVEMLRDALEIAPERADEWFVEAMSYE